MTTTGTAPDIFQIAGKRVHRRTSSVAQLEQNLGARDIVLTADPMTELTDAAGR